MLTSFIDEYPEISAIAIAVLGFLAARLLSRLADYWFVVLERRLRRIAPLQLEKRGLSAIQPLVRGAFYYITLFFFLLLAVQTLGIDAVEEGLDAVLGYIPQLILAGLIIVAGYLLSVITRSLVAGLLGGKPDHLLPRFAQLLVLTVAVVTSLGQMAVDISFISNVIVIFLAAFVGGLALAFALGSKQLVENLLARRHLERYRVGSAIRVRGIEGKIIELLPTAVVIESEEGTTAIPAARFAASEVLVFHQEADDGSPNEGK